LYEDHLAQKSEEIKEDFGYFQLIDESHEDKGIKSLGRTKIKQDFGYKTLLRGMRLCLRDAMNRKGSFKGRHHWDD